MALGDGWAVVSVDDAAQVRLLNGGSGPALGRVEAGAVSIDGVRTLAWQNAEGTHVGRVDGLPLTAPRLLAAHDADVVRRGQTWRPQFDFTAAVVAGVVEVRDEAGALVPSLPTKAAAEGSVRGLTGTPATCPARRCPPAGTPGRCGSRAPTAPGRRSRWTAPECRRAP